MNTESKLVAAAKRAARRISHAENVPYQNALDRVARQAGRSSWSAFVADPVAIDQAAADAASEPDFAKVSPDAHLVGAIDYGISIGARALLARPEILGHPARLVYCSARSDEFDHPIDARGISVAAMVTSLAAAPSSADGRATIQDGRFAFEFDDLGGTSQLRLSLDDTLPPAAPFVEDEAVERGHESRRQQRLSLRSKAVRVVSPLQSGIDRYDVLDTLVPLAWNTMRADLIFEHHKTSVDVVMQVGGERSIVHVMTIDDYRTLMAMTKDRARMDQMETRIPQHGDYGFMIDGQEITVCAVTKPIGSMEEELQIGFVPFPRRTYAKRPYYEHPQGGRLLLGEHGLFQRSPVHAKENSLVVVSGARGSGRTSRFVIPAIADSDGADVIVSDMDGDMTVRLGATWALHQARIHIDPRRQVGRREPAFNPLHPDMTGSGHMAAAEWIALTLLPDDEEVSRSARSLLIGAVDVVTLAPDLRTTKANAEDVPTLPMVHDWLRASVDRLPDVMVQVAASGAVHARIRLERFMALPEDVRRAALDRLLSALAFVDTPGMREILAPADEDRGAALAAALVLKRAPALVVVGGDARIGQGRLCALVMQAAVHLREEFARRETHLFVDDAAIVGAMPWLGRALPNEHGMIVGMSATVVLEDPHEIDALAPALAGGPARGIRHWLVEEVQDHEDRARIADAMSVRRSKVTSHRVDGRRIDVSDGDVRLLRR